MVAILIAASTGAGGFVLVRAVSRPDLGPGPAGARHGGTPEAIATALAGDLVRALVSQAHAVTILTERDLTVIARARNPNPSRFHDPEARVRDGQVVIDASSSLGPFDVVTVARSRLSLSPAGDISADVGSVEVGTLPVPDWARGTLDPWSPRALPLDRLLDTNPVLGSLRQDLDCVAVEDDGVHLGAHRPGAAPDPSACGPAASG